MSGIFLIHDGGELVEMRESPYDSEDLLQSLIEKYPNLLAGDQIDGLQPRRWLLVSREISVPGEEGGVGRLDHLFLDQDAIPTLIEVKRSSDTRIRREVVGQMLDYAANAGVYLPVDLIREKFNATCSMRQTDPEVELALVTGEGVDPGEFWQKVKTNLQAGRIRMLFVADEIPPELRRIVEFLNNQMDPAEVLALEIKQFVGQGMKTLVPRLIGQTAMAQQRKVGGTEKSQKVDEATFIEDLTSRQKPDEEAAARKILAWSKQSGLEPGYFKTQKGCSFIPTLRHKGIEYYPLSLRTSGYLILQMKHLIFRPPFDLEDLQEKLLARLNDISEIKFKSERMKGMPSIPLAVLANQASFEKVTAILQWMTDQIRAT